MPCCLPKAITWLLTESCICLFEKPLNKDNFWILTASSVEYPNSLVKDTWSCSLSLENIADVPSSLLISLDACSIFFWFWTILVPYDAKVPADAPA